MRLTPPLKLALIVVTVLPLIYLAMFFVFMAFAFSSPAKDPFFGHSGALFGIHLLMMLLMFALLAFYIVFLFKTERIRPDMKALWAIVLFFGSPVAMPIFWYLYIWRENEAPAADRRPA